MRSFAFFEESLTRILIISEGYPRLNGKQSSDNVLQALVSLTTKNHELFLTEFIQKFISLIEENKAKLDASLLQALLQVQQVFHAF